MDLQCEPWLPSPCFTPTLVNFTSFSPPSTGSGEQAEMPASLWRLWMGRWAQCWKSSLAPLLTFALELRRHNSKQLEVLTTTTPPSPEVQAMFQCINVRMLSTRRVGLAHIWRMYTMTGACFGNFALELIRLHCTSIFASLHYYLCTCLIALVLASLHFTICVFCLICPPLNIILLPLLRLEKKE